RLFEILDPRQREQQFDWLSDAGYDPAAAVRVGQLDIRTPEETYLRSGRFDEAATLRLLDDVLRQAPRDRYPTTRLIAHAERVFDGDVTPDEWIAYEARADLLIHQYPDPVVCVYDAPRLPAGVA